jgi:hypothetical protein
VHAYNLFYFLFFILKPLCDSSLITKCYFPAFIPHRGAPQLAKINNQTIVYVGHHLSSTFAPLKDNGFQGCKLR